MFCPLTINANIFSDIFFASFYNFFFLRSPIFFLLKASNFFLRLTFLGCLEATVHSDFGYQLSARLKLGPYFI
jgi:hypothetical protein